MAKTTVHTLKISGPFKEIHDFYDSFDKLNKPVFRTRYVSDKLPLRDEFYKELKELKDKGEILDFSPVEEVIVRDGYFSFLIIEENNHAELEVSLRNLIPIPEGVIASDESHLAENYQDWFLEEFGVANDVFASETIDNKVYKNENGENYMTVTLILETGFGNLDIFIGKLIERYPHFEFYSTYQSVDEDYAGVIYWSKDKHTHSYFTNDERSPYKSYRHYLLENTQLPLSSCKNCNADIITALDKNICPNCGQFNFE